MKQCFFSIAFTCWLLPACTSSTQSPSSENLNSAVLPNIVYIMADDLGYRELGAYGQEIIRTPNLDLLADQGMLFTQHYSGSTVCAPSRCTLLTGKHTGNSFVRDNFELGDFSDENEGGQLPLPPNTFTLATMLKEKGYRTGAVGKWGLGGPGSTGVPNKQGFDYFYGYLCQKQAHNYYPTHLWENQAWDTLDNDYFVPHQKHQGNPEDLSSYKKYSGNQYTMDLMADKAMDFIQRNRDQHFFLYLAFPVPHLALQAPDQALKLYQGQFPETPYLGENGYLPHPYPRAAYAAMITYMDQKIGLILEQLEQLGLSENTLVVFTSDNGTTFDVGGVDRNYFNSLGPLRGHKTTLYEGGIRVPLIIRWPGKVAAGSISELVCANWDVLPTIAELVQADISGPIDGISFFPTLMGTETQEYHDYLYWEFHGRWNGAQAVRSANWKAVRLGGHNDAYAPIELYNLKEDLGESMDISDHHPEVVARMQEIMNQRTNSHIEKWNFKTASTN